MTCILLCIYGVIALIGSGFSPLYRVSGRYARLVYLGAIGQFLELSASAGALVAGAGPVGVAVGLLASRVCIVCWAFWDTRAERHIYFDGNVSLQDGVHELRKVLVPSAGFALLPFAHTFYFQGILVIVKAHLGAEAGIAFAAIRTLSRVLVQGSSFIANSVWIEFTRYFGAGDLVNARKLFTHSTRFVGFIVGVGTTGLLVFGPIILSFWTHGTVVVGMPTLIPFLAASAVNALWAHLFSVPYSCNRHTALAVMYCVLTCALAAFSTRGGHIPSITAFAWSLFAIDLIMFAATIAKTHTLLAMDLAHWLHLFSWRREYRSAT